MQRILIIGNSGSGKSWLARHLQTICKQELISLDDVIWQPGGFNIKRSEADVEQRLQDIAGQPRWIVEGVFGRLAERLIDAADVLIYLDMPWAVCEQSLLARGSESSKQLDAAQAEINFQELLCWAEGYYQRSSKSSQYFHQSLYLQFKGQKYLLQSRESVAKFCESFAATELN